MVVSRGVSSETVATFLEHVAADGFTPAADNWLCGVDPELSRALGARGWLGMSCPVQYGGKGASAVDRFVVTEELLAARRPGRRALDRRAADGAEHAALGQCLSTRMADLVELIDPELLEHTAEQRASNAEVMIATAGMSAVDTRTPAGLAWIREAMAPGGLFGFQGLDFPESRTIAGPAGDLPARVLIPDVVSGVYLHLHGGGMSLGSALSMDRRNWAIAQACDVAVVSVDYRLAPEHPFPAGPDDAEAAALWLIANAAAEFGSDRLLIGGESAGAYLALLTMIRLRDRLGGAPPFAGVDCCYGIFDWGGTPSSRSQVGKVPYATGDGANRERYLPGRSLEECRDPAVSPLWAPLHDLPPTLLTVGTADWLLDDSLFVAARMAAAGSPVELAVYPEGPHGVESADTTVGRAARDRLHDFLRRRIS